MTLHLVSEGTKRSLAALYFYGVGSKYYYLHFIHKRNETGKNYITCSILHRMPVEKEFKPRTGLLSNKGFE